MMNYETYHTLQRTLKYCDIWPYEVFFGQRYKVGCRKHCHCYCTAKTWKEAKNLALMISKMPDHRNCIVNIHDGQSGFKIGFVNGIMGIISNFNLLIP